MSSANDAWEWRIIYQSNRLVVLDKPSGLLAVPGRGPHLQDCLSARVQAVLPTALIVHRLDRDTSGLMVMALDAPCQRDLSAQFAARTVEKRYIALVYGSPAADEGSIEIPMRKDIERPPRHRIDLVDGRSAKTNWRVIERMPDRTRLEVMPVTGRSHQIRLHLATIGHPILGDNLYASEEALGLAPRLMLHAEQLSLVDPGDGQRHAWQSICPF